MSECDLATKQFFTNYDYVRNNRFVVRCEDIDIPEWMVGGVTHYPKDSEIILRYMCFIFDSKSGKEIENAEDYFTNLTTKEIGDVNIDILDGTGRRLYTRKFNDCTVTGVMFGKLDYQDHSPAHINVYVKYKSYEIVKNV